MAFYNLDPFGAEREDMRAALVTAAVANANRDADTDPYSIEDFMLRLGERALIAHAEPEAETLPTVTAEQGVATLEMLNAMFQGRDLRKN